MKATKVLRFNEIESDSDATSVSADPPQVISSQSSRDHSPIQILEPAQPPKFVESIQPFPIKQQKHATKDVQQEYWLLNEVDDEDDFEEEEQVEQEPPLEQEPEQQEVVVEKEPSIEEEYQADFMDQYQDFIEEDIMPRVEQETVHKVQKQAMQPITKRKGDLNQLLKESTSALQKKRGLRYNPKSSLIYFRIMGKEHQYRKYQDQSLTEELQPNQVDELVDDLELDFVRVESIISAGLSIKHKQKPVIKEDRELDRSKVKEKERPQTQQSQKKERKAPKPREDDQSQKDRYVFAIKGKKATFSGLVLYQVEIMDKLKLGIQWLRYSEIALINKGIEEIYTFESRACDRLAVQLQCQRIDKYTQVESFLQHRIVDGRIFDATRIFIQQEKPKQTPEQENPPEVVEEYYTTRKRKQVKPKQRNQRQQRIQQKTKEVKIEVDNDELDLDDSFMEALKYLEDELEIADEQLLNADEIKLFQIGKVNNQQDRKKRLIYDDEDEEEVPVNKQKDKLYEARKSPSQNKLVRNSKPVQRLVQKEKQKKKPILEFVGERVVEPIKKKITKKEPNFRQKERKVKPVEEEINNSLLEIEEQNEDSPVKLEKKKEKLKSPSPSDDESMLDVDNMKILTQAKNNKEQVSEKKNQQEEEEVYTSTKQKIRQQSAQKASKKLKKENSEAIRYFYDPQGVQKKKRQAPQQKETEENQSKKPRSGRKSKELVDMDLLDADKFINMMESKLKTMLLSFVQKLLISGHKTIDNKVILTLDYLDGTQSEQRREVLSQTHSDQVTFYLKDYLLKQ